MKEIKELINPHGELDYFLVAIFCLMMGVFVHWALFWIDDSPTNKYSWFILAIWFYGVIMGIVYLVKINYPYAI